VCFQEKRAAELRVDSLGLRNQFDAKEQQLACAKVLQADQSWGNSMSTVADRNGFSANRSQEPSKFHQNVRPSRGFDGLAVSAAQELRVLSTTPHTTRSA
jgi:hypothetical protein